LPFDLKKLGDDEQWLRPAALATPGGLFVTSKEFARLNMVMRTWSGRRAALQTVGRAVKSIVLQPTYGHPRSRSDRPAPARCEGGGHSAVAEYAAGSR